MTRYRSRVLEDDSDSVIVSWSMALRVGPKRALIVGLIAQLQADGPLYGGRRWARASVRELAEYLAHCFSEDTISRYLSDLREAEIILSEQRPSGDGRRALWHSVVEDAPTVEGQKLTRWIRTERSRSHALRADIASRREEVFADLVRRDGEHCRYCGTSDRLQIDHVTPLAKGGDNALGNLQLLCCKCNARKGARL